MKALPAMKHDFRIQPLLLSFALMLGSGANSVWAQSESMAFLLPSGGGSTRDAAGQQKAWKYGEFSGIRLQARERDAPMNDHPLKPDVTVVERALASVEIVKSNDRVVPLLDAAEARSLAVSLSLALDKASSQEDVLVFSSARRESGMLALPATVVARIFMAQGQLNLIVQEARADLVAKIRSTRLMPELSFGSRSQASGVQLKTSKGQLKRPDWVVLPMTERVEPALQQPVATPQVAQPAVAVSGAGRDAAYFKAQAARLEGLRQLREQSLISEDEYQQKRKAIIDDL